MITSMLDAESRYIYIWVGPDLSGKWCLTRSGSSHALLPVPVRGPAPGRHRVGKCNYVLSKFRLKLSALGSGSRRSSTMPRYARSELHCVAYTVDVYAYNLASLCSP